MSIGQDVTQLACQVAHVPHWADVEQVLPSPRDPSALLLRAPHRIGILSLAAASPQSQGQCWSQPHRRLTAACWLPGNGSGGGGIVSDSAPRFAVGDATSTVRLVPRAIDQTTRHEAGGPLPSTTIVVDRDSLVSSVGGLLGHARSTPQLKTHWAIREVLPIAADGAYLLAQRSTTTARGTEQREGVSSSDLVGAHHHGAQSASSAQVWVLSAERQSSWSVQLRCAAGRGDDVPVLMPVLPGRLGDGLGAASTPQCALCSSQAITICRGPTLTTTVSFVFNTSPSVTGEVLKVFAAADDDNAHRYTALVRQQHGPRTAVWLAEWDERYPAAPTWWSSLMEESSIPSTNDDVLPADPRYVVTRLPQRAVYAVAVLPTKPGPVHRLPLFTVRAPMPSSSSQDHACTTVKPCVLDVASLFSHSSDCSTAESLLMAPSDVRGMSCVGGVMKFVHFSP